MDINLDSLLAIVIVFGFGLIIYSKVRKQTVRDTVEGIRDSIGGESE